MKEEMGGDIGLLNFSRKRHSINYAMFHHEEEIN